MCAADVRLQLVETETGKAQRVDLDRNRFLAIVAELDVHGEIVQFQHFVELDEEVHKGLLILVVQCTARAVQAVGGVGLVREAVMEDVEDGRVALIIEISIYRILLAFDVLLNEEFLRSDDEFGKL